MKENNMKKGRLSNDDFNSFKENIHLSDDELADKLHRNVNFIKTTRKRVYPNKKTGKWNKIDIETLKNNYSKMSTEELARLLNRTEKGINSKLQTFEPGMGTVKINGSVNIPHSKHVYFSNVDDSHEVEIVNPGLNNIEEELFPVNEECCGGSCNDKNEVKSNIFIRLYNFLKVW